MAGIYLHIPFCRRACHYCDFHFTTNLRNTVDVEQAILKEITLRKDYLSGEPISTIYFGGGTPSLLPSSSIAAIMDELQKTHSVQNGAEITLEANPEDLSEEKLKELQRLGINRLSLGTQSFIDAELKWMNRMHTAQQAIRAIKDAQDIGFHNISIDLIFGLPQQTAAHWQHNLDTAIELDIQHISSYGLTIEKKTVLGSRIAKGSEKLPDEEMASTFFRMNMDFFSEHGFEHYEISNFAKEGFISKHNSSYWQGVNYIGLGPSAHSFNGSDRQWNVRSNAAYVRAIAQQKKFFEHEELTVTDRLNERIMIGLRTKWGIRKEEMELISADAWDKMMKTVNTLPPSYFEKHRDELRLSNEGMLLADGLAVELFFT